MENKSVEESIITALDGEDVKIIKYLPYILQDFWDIGTPPEDIIEIIKKHKNNYAELTLLDLGSGKGAVSVNAASVLKCKCFGIDAMEDFVAFANNKAQEFSAGSTGRKARRSGQKTHLRSHSGGVHIHVLAFEGSLYGV